MRIRHDITAMNTVRFLGMTGGRMEKHTERLSSGYRINRGADDAAGLSISEKMRRQIRGLTQACANAQDGISLVQSAEGALHEVHDMLQRLNVLAIQSANGTNGEAERSYLQEEVSQILGEVDRIASTTSFNGRLLLDGSLGRKEGGGQSVTPYIRFFDETVYEVIADQNPSYRAFYTEEQERAWGGVKRMLEEAIVPQAVTAIVQRLGDTFSYLNGSEIGIGLILYENADSSTVASVALRTAHSTTPVLDVDVSYSLRVNMAMLYLDEANNYSLSEQTRNYLERTIAHEMMHALMEEALTSGMAGLDANMQNTDRFPLWFVEGTAQAVGGGISWVESRSGLGLSETSTVDEIREKLSGTHELGSGTSGSQYATGYLAVMYLSHLAGGGGAVTADHLANGLDQILSTIRGGASLDQAIALHTGQAYRGISDFQTAFAQDGAAFVQELLLVSGGGEGALVAGDLQRENLLDDVAMLQPLFDLNTEYEEVWNSYPEDYIVLSGGTAHGEGTPGPETDSGTGGTGSGTGTGGTGSGTGTGGTGTGETGGGIFLQLGNEAGESLTLYIEAVSTAVLGIDKMDISTREGALTAIDMTRKAIHGISRRRAALGACQNRLEHTVRNLDNIVENTQSAESRIRDTDMAAEMLELSTCQILGQAGQAMLAQTGQQREGVLMLLRG